uniref:Uncharacterized protein n=1 Tax=Arundo donax TaxID=35708 RepID=A0A0A9HJ05_ARUDO
MCNMSVTCVELCHRRLMIIYSTNWSLRKRIRRRGHQA